MLLPNNPREIEARSFAIIERHLKSVKFSPSLKPIVKRVIHATCDISYAWRLLFGSGAVKVGINALKRGARIIVDAQMVKAGINKKLLKSFGSRIFCRLAAKSATSGSRSASLTRSTLAMRNSRPWMKDSIVVVGNAPTALFEVCRLVKEKKVRPALVIGVPVGFVGAVQAKREVRSCGIPYITNRGRKGGSACAVAIMNALLIMADAERQKLCE